MKNKERLDVLLVSRGLCETRSKAQAVIMSGLVYVDGQKADKPGVSYEETVDAGIDFQAVDISIDEEQKLITLKVPEAHITNLAVDMSSLDFIFLNQKTNKSGVTEAAYKACEEDVQRESEQQTAICELAKQNAENVLKALTKPIVDQLGDGYQLVIE